MEFSPFDITNPSCLGIIVDGRWEYEDFMLGNWAWRQACDIIIEDLVTHGQYTVSVATGQNEYTVVHVQGLVCNGVRRAHRNAVTLIGFLAIPKVSDRENQDCTEFRTFHRNLFHRSLCHIFSRSSWV
ncbi:hypothetical protein B0H10DRAFT_2033900 [Mycena sp. CBHHK59/15]|nr:hypothetical protein B0H10DRAFT_2033900 [Mycena sp. CBHHK59/15]